MASYQKRGKAGLWSVRFDIQKNGETITKRLSGFSTKKDCQQAYHDFITKFSNNSESYKPLSFVRLAYEYQEYLKTKNKPSTVYDFNSKSNKHLLPFFAKYNVIDITPKIILEWQQQISHYSYNYKCHLRDCLSGLLTYADKYYNIPNQLKKVDTFRNTEFKKEMQIWSPEEFKTVASNIDNIIYKTFFYCLFYTGTRKGEMLATTWDDWNLEQTTLTIAKSITRKINNASWMLTTPKNKSSYRTIKIPSFIVDMIKELKEYYLKNSIPLNFVFSGEKPLPETNIKRALISACKKCSIEPIRIHDFRHSHASYLISKGASIVAVAKRLGHSGIEQTLNTYSHLMPKEEDKLVNLLT